MKDNSQQPVAKSAKEVLIAARWILENVGWCQGDFQRWERDAKGRIVNPVKPWSFCAIGALNIVCCKNLNSLVNAKIALGRLTGLGESIVSYNDIPGRTKEEVLALFKVPQAKGGAVMIGDKETVGWVVKWHKAPEHPEECSYIRGRDDAWVTRDKATIFPTREAAEAQRHGLGRIPQYRKVVRLVRRRKTAPLPEYRITGWVVRGRGVCEGQYLTADYIESGRWQWGQFRDAFIYGLHAAAQKAAEGSTGSLCRVVVPVYHTPLPDK